MKTNALLASLCFAAASLLGVPSAQASSLLGFQMVAGWDFSQYLGDGLLTVDGVEPANTLPANYSNLDPTFNAGAESAAFGTMVIDGSLGSTNVDPFAGELLPTANSLASNLDAPVAGGGSIPFDTDTVLQFEGQTFFNELSMIALAPATAVFLADLRSVGLTGIEWSLSFGAKTFSGASVLGVEYSIDGVDFAPVGDVSLDTNDTPFLVPLPGTETDTAYVRLSFQTANGNPILDNVAIHATVVPEPGTALLLLTGLAGLLVGGRRRV